MVTAKRSKHNPILTPQRSHNWEALASFNGSIVKDNHTYHLLYRAISVEQLYKGKRMNLSVIGHAQSGDGVHFRKRSQFIIPENPWENYGCEDPRVTEMDGKYYIFYTAISGWPPAPEGIKVAVAVTDDFQNIKEKHLVTPFNAKAMVMFPERINGKITCLLTVNTDLPPSKICLAQFDEVEDIWNQDCWTQWYETLDQHELKLFKSDRDQLEVGAVPVRTGQGWILVFGFVQNYFNEKERIFRIDAALLDLDNPAKVIGQSMDPLLVPEEEYEIYGLVPNVIFPSGAIAQEGQFIIYYGAADTTVCRASITINDLLDELTLNPAVNPYASHHKAVELVRHDGNPIITPVRQHRWESKYTFNAGSIFLNDRIHIIYRAMGEDDTSVFGYATTRDGVNIDERLPEPAYVPREAFETKSKPGFSGCEDPRLTVIGESVFMCYTAYDGVNPPRIAMSSIPISDFLARRWNWSKPKLISAPGEDNKDSCVVADKINKNYIIFHRINPCIWIDVVSDLTFSGSAWLGGHPLFGPRPNSWDSLKVGLGGPPEKTDDGWLLIYHGVSKYDDKYRLGAALLSLENPLQVTARLLNPILEPVAAYEYEGYRPGTVFSNGQAVIGDTLYVYYGAADETTAVATVPLSQILDALKSGK